MLHRIHQKLGTAGFVIAIVALIAALGGTALAAAKLNGTQKKEVEKISKKYAGAPGTNGTNGSNGAPGAKGDAGAPGTAGTNGTNGTSATTETFTGSKTVGAVTCTEGGTVVKSASAETAVCNGKKGTNGTPGTNGTNGSPWTAGGTLPSGSTETGAWAIGYFTEEAFTSISFNIPLAAPLDTTHVIKVATEAVPAEEHCTNGVAPEASAENPEAAPGYLCVYTGAFNAGGHLESVFQAGKNINFKGASTSGAALEVDTAAAEDFGSGTWAVTAP